MHLRVLLDDAHFARLAARWERGRHAGTWRRGLRMAAEGLGAVAVMYLILRRGAGMGFIAAALFGGWLGARYLRRRKGARSPDWREAAGGEAEYIFDPRALWVRSERLDLRLAWHAIERAVVFADGVLLLVGPRNFHWVPLAGEGAAVPEILRRAGVRVVRVR